MGTQIAYIGTDMRFHLADSEGAATTSVEAPGITHAWPVWSPTCDRVAFSVFSSGSNGSGLLSLYLHEVGRDLCRHLYTNEYGADAIAKGTPHYCLWSPDGARVAVIARTKRPGLTLFTIDLSNPNNPFRIIDGMPLFTSWSPDSRFLLSHCGTEHYLVDFTGEAGVSRLEGGSGLYMAPSWSPVANQYATLRQNDNSSQTLQIDDMGKEKSKSVIDIRSATAFAWNARGDKLAIVRDPRQGTRLYDGLWVVNSDGSGQTRVTGDPVLSFFWSPTSSRIAYVTTSDDPHLSLRWVVVDTETGKLKPLLDFSPTEQQLTAFWFFDQYAQSHNPWSQDGEKVIFSGLSGRTKQSVTFPLPDQSSVIVLDIESGKATTVAEGIFASWSPHRED